MGVPTQMRINSIARIPVLVDLQLYTVAGIGPCYARI